MKRGMALLLLALWSTSASAEKSGVIESHVLTRPPEAARLMPAVLDYYGATGYLVGPSLGEKLEEVWGAPGREMTADELTEATALIDKGYRAWIQGEFADAVKHLTRGLERFMANPATLAREPLNRQVVFKALVYKAAAHRRLNETDQATATMAELIRSFPDTPVSRSTHGPEAFEFYQAVRQQVTTQGRGQLIVTVDDPNVVLFVNGRYEGVGKITKTDLVPGEYRVYMQKGTVSGRMHKVSIEANRETKLQVEWIFESSLVTGPTWVGFAFLSRDLQQKNELEFAKRIGIRMGMVNLVIHSIEIKDRTRSIVGRVLSVATGSYPRSGMIQLDPLEPTPDGMKALGVYVSGGPLEGPVKISQPPADVAGGAADTGPPMNPWVIPAWGSAAVGAGTLGLGIFLMVRDGNCSGSAPANTQCQKVYDTMLPGIGLAAGGLAVGGLSAYFFYKAGKWRSLHPVAAIAPTSGGAVFTFSGAF
jgi:hypothetical protein